MANYVWECKSCHSDNSGDQVVCARCGLPADASAADIRNWLPEKGYRKPKDAQGGIYGVVPCPACKVHMFVRDKECHHCGHVLSQAEIKEITAKYQYNFRTGAIWAVVVLGVLFALALLWRGT